MLRIDCSARFTIIPQELRTAPKADQERPELHAQSHLVVRLAVSGQFLMVTKGIPLFATDEPADITGVSPTTILVRGAKQGVAEWFRLQLKEKTWNRQEGPELSPPPSTSG